jgi:hypothetical protein
MITDAQALLSSAQAITATAASTNYYDCGASPDSGVGEPLQFAISVPAAFDALTSLAISLEVDDNTSFSSAATLWSKTFLLATLVINAELKVPGFVRGMERYARLKYTVAGSNPTVGTITAYIVKDLQANTPTANAI